MIPVLMATGLIMPGSAPLADLFSGFISPYSAVLVLLLLLGWARLLTWIDKDAPAAHLPRAVMNCITAGSGILGYLLFFLLPGAWLAFGALVVCKVAGVGVYLGIRHKKVGLADLKTELAGLFSRGPKKVEAPPGDVAIFNKGGSPLAAPEAESPDRPAYDAVQRLLTDPLRKDAERFDVYPAEGVASVQYVVDLVVYNAPSMSMHDAQLAIGYLKSAAGMDVNDRRKPQRGKIKTVLDGKRREIEVQTAGSTAGESMRLVVEPGKRHERRLADLGLLAEQLEAVQQSVQTNQGIVLVCAPRGAGLTTMLYSLLRAHDAFLQHIQSIERNRETDLEGITQNALPPGATTADELKQVEWVCSQQPEVVMLDQIANPASGRELIRFVSEGRRAYIGMRAPATFDALTLWRKIVGDDALALKHLDLIIAGRVARRLCLACKVGYAPDPEQLRKMNMDPSRVTKLYQARTQPIRDKKGNPVPCEFCHDLRYKGRFGVYEVLKITDDIRNGVLSGASSSQLRTLFRRQRGRFLQEAALARVEEGETSVQEVLRAMKGDEPQPRRQAESTQQAAPQ